MKRLVLIFWILLWTTPSWGQSLITIPGTPDISISTTATAHFQVFPAGSRAGPVRWFMLQNDCAEDLQFAFNVGTGSVAGQYVLRLPQDAQFSTFMRLRTFAVSNDSESVSCTFTFIGGR